MQDIKLADGSIILRKAKESNIDDRLMIGRHNEFVHICGGDRLENTTTIL